MSGQGFISLYNIFDDADIEVADDKSGAYLSRKWISNDDRVGIALAGNNTVTFKDIAIGTQSGLLFETALPWWTEESQKSGEISLEISISEKGSDDYTALYTWNSRNPQEKNNVDLSQWAGKRVNIRISTTGLWGRGWTVDGKMFRHRAHGARPKATNLIRLKP